MLEYDDFGFFFINLTVVIFLLFLILRFNIYFYYLL